MRLTERCGDESVPVAHDEYKRHGMNLAGITSPASRAKILVSRVEGETRQSPHHPPLMTVWSPPPFCGSHVRPSSAPVAVTRECSTNRFRFCLAKKKNKVQILRRHRSGVPARAYSTRSFCGENGG